MNPSWTSAMVAAQDRVQAATREYDRALANHKPTDVIVRRLREVEAERHELERLTAQWVEEKLA